MQHESLNSKAQVLTRPKDMGTITDKTIVNRGHIQWGEQVFDTLPILQCHALVIIFCVFGICLGKPGCDMGVTPWSLYLVFLLYVWVGQGVTWVYMLLFRIGFVLIGSVYY
jgi:hypothetical protein